MNNLKELFEIQAGLDSHILKNHPELKGQDNLDWKVLALQVELGECANEWRGFKKWSKDQEPRHAKLLEEYVDCLHFILSIGIELGFTDIEIWNVEEGDTTKFFLKCFENINSLYFVYCVDGEVSTEIYEHLFGAFIELGKTLGFTWEKVHQAYLEKNQINHHRQINNY
ncbi:dUTP diphosphatase [Priestia megaterium]